MLILGCKKESTDIGVNLRPDGGVINGTFITLDNLVTRTIAEDSLRTDSLNRNILGVINDPLFGEYRASLICQPKLPETDYDFSSANLDSITLTLKFARSQIIESIERLLVYGDLDDVIDIDIYKVDEVLEPGERYFSNDQIALGDQIGTYSGKMPFFDSVLVKTGNDSFLTTPQLHIRLDDAFGLDMIGQPASVYEDQEAFLEYLKGIALVPRMNKSVGEGVIVGISLNNTGTVMTLHHDDTASKDFVFTNVSERINLYDYNLSSNILAQQAGSGHYNETYVQAMGAAKVRIDVPGLDSIIEKGGNVVINEAEFVLKLKDGSYTEEYPAPPRMLLLQPQDSTGRNLAIIDFIDQVSPPFNWIGQTNYGGLFDENLGGYKFHFNRYLQQLIKTYNETGENRFKGFYFVIPSDFPLIPSRAVLDTDLNGGGIELSIVYTKLN